MNKVAVKRWDELADRDPAYALVAGVDLVVVRFAVGRSPMPTGDWS